MQRNELRAILVPQGRVQQGIEQAADTQPDESSRELRADPPDRADRNLLERRRVSGVWIYGANTMIASTSTPAPRGSEATPIAARAG